MIKWLKNLFKKDVFDGKRVKLLEQEQDYCEIIMLFTNNLSEFESMYLSNNPDFTERDLEILYSIRKEIELFKKS